MTLPATFARQDQRDPTNLSEITSGQGGEALIKAFHKLFPDVARREVRSEHVRNEGEPGGIPAGEYFFVESYCTNPGCPCERVLIDVWARGLGIVASISYDFDPARAPTYRDQPNPCLDPSIPQGKYAKNVLAMFTKVIAEREYFECLKRHYRLVKSAVGSASGRHDGGMTSGRDEGVRQKRKQQKAARRMNRRR